MAVWEKDEDDNKIEQFEKQRQKKTEKKNKTKSDLFQISFTIRLSLVINHEETVSYEYTPNNVVDSWETFL